MTGVPMYLHTILLSLIALSSETDQIIFEHDVPSYVGITLDIVCSSQVVTLRAGYNDSQTKYRIRGISVDGIDVNQSELDKIGEALNANEEISVRSLSRCGNRESELAMVHADLWNRKVDGPPNVLLFWISQDGKITSIERPK